MNSSKLILTLTLAITFIGGLKFAEANGSGRGGGNVCFENGLGAPPILLDLAGKLQPVDESQDGVKIKITSKMKTFGFDRAEILSDPRLSSLINTLVDRHKGAAPRSVELIQQAIKGLNLYAMKFEIGHAVRADYSDTPMCSESNVRAAVLYTENWALISAPLWNKLSLKSQAALVIHEALRNIQIRYSGAQTDLELQRVTASIVLSADDEDLDHSPFFTRYFADKPTSEDITQNLSSRVCEKRTDLESLISDRSSDSLPLLRKELGAFCDGDTKVLPVLRASTLQVRTDLLSANSSLALSNSSAEQRLHLSYLLIDVQSLISALASAELGEVNANEEQNSPDLQNAISSLNDVKIELMLKEL